MLYMSTSSVKDYLKIDPPVPNQKFYCVSIVGPKFRQKSDDIKVMVRGGSFATADEAMTYAKTANQVVDIYCGQIGYWSAFSTEDSSSSDPNAELNLAMGEYLRDQVRKDLEYQRVTSKRISEAQKEGQSGKASIPSSVSLDETTANDDESKSSKVKSNTKETNKDTNFKSEKPLPSNEYACISFLSPIENSKHRTYGFKVHSVFSTVEECTKHMKTLDNFEKKILLHVVQVGEWLKWDPDASEIENQAFSDPMVNTIMQGQKHENERVERYKQEQEELLMQQEMQEELSKTIPTNNDRFETPQEEVVESEDVIKVEELE